MKVIKDSTTPKLAEVVATRPLRLKVIKDSTTPKQKITDLPLFKSLKVIKDSTTPKLAEIVATRPLRLKVIKDSTTPKPQNMRPNSAIFNIIII